ncbi:hypothetical protein ACIBF5_09660 [Micromonospora sp. NPDC050417]|uniref:hypothetical protein n=1 Tax=Micromonospora sp. NPDC050417 TaxID=3364280 RepID=UPI003792112B
MGRVTDHQGLPVFRPGEIPEHLATVTMLGQQHRRLADGQACVAYLLYSLGNHYTPLYRVVDAVTLPPLSPGRQARYDEVRLCARCRAHKATPWPRDHTTRRRVCPWCAEAEAKSSWLAERNQARAAAVKWATEVIDAGAVLIHEEQAPGASWTVAAADVVTGAELVDAWILPHWATLQEHPEAVTGDGPELIGDVAPRLKSLTGRRLIAWGAGHVKRLRSALTGIGEQDILPLVRPGEATWTPDQAPGDELGVWYAEWLGVRAREASWRYDRTVRQHAVPCPAGDPALCIVAAELRLLHLIAADDHPAGPVTCPTLLPGTRTICGAPGPLLEGRWCQLCAEAHVDAVLSGEEPAA